MKGLEKLNREIIACEKCPRLVEWTRRVAEEKVRRYRDQDYWGKAVPSFGDPDADLYIVGLAPGAHGANRTGRMFTGDSSGDWLYKAMYENGFASQPTSESLGDGLVLDNAWITAVAHCAPPLNKLVAAEIRNCADFLSREMELFRSAKVILCLGGIAFKQSCKQLGLKGLKFGHAAEYKLDDGRILIASYHPSQQNTRTGRLLWADWFGIFRRCREIIEL